MPIAFISLPFIPSIPHDLAADSVYEACLNSKFNLSLSIMVFKNWFLSVL